MKITNKIRTISIQKNDMGLFQDGKFIKLVGDQSKDIEGFILNGGVPLRHLCGDENYITLADFEDFSANAISEHYVLAN